MLVDKGEAPELIPLHVVEDVGGGGVRRGGGHGQVFELAVKVLRFTGIRLEEYNRINLTNSMK